MITLNIERRKQHLALVLTVTMFCCCFLNCPQYMSFFLFSFSGVGVGVGRVVSSSLLVVIVDVLMSSFSSPSSPCFSSSAILYRSNQLRNNFVILYLLHSNFEFAHSPVFIDWIFQSITSMRRYVG